MASMTCSMYSSSPNAPCSTGMSRALCQSMTCTSWSDSRVRMVGRISVVKCPDMGPTTSTRGWPATEGFSKCSRVANGVRVAGRSAGRRPSAVDRHGCDAECRAVMGRPRVARGCRRPRGRGGDRASGQGAGQRLQCPGGQLGMRPRRARRPAGSTRTRCRAWDPTVLSLTQRATYVTASVTGLVVGRAQNRRRACPRPGRCPRGALEDGLMRSEPAADAGDPRRPPSVRPSRVRAGGGWRPPSPARR